MTGCNFGPPVFAASDMIVSARNKARFQTGCMRPKMRESNSCCMRRVIWRAVLALAFIAIVSPSSAADMYPRQAGIKILKYSFEVTLGDESDELTVKDTIDVQLLADGVLGFDLDLCQLVTTPHGLDRLDPCL